MKKLVLGLFVAVSLLLTSASAVNMQDPESVAKAFLEVAMTTKRVSRTKGKYMPPEDVAKIKNLFKLPHRADTYLKTRNRSFKGHVKQRKKKGLSTTLGLKVKARNFILNNTKCSVAYNYFANTDMTKKYWSNGYFHMEYINGEWKIK